MPSFGGSLSDIFGSSSSPSEASFDLGAEPTPSSLSSHSLPVALEPAAAPQKAWYNPF